MRSRLLVLVVLGLAIVVAAAVLAWRQSAPGVDITLEPLTAVGLETPIRITVEAARGEVAAVEVRLVQGDRAGEVLRRDVAGQRVELEAMIEGRALGLAEGPATLEVRAGDDFWRPLGREPTQVRVPVTVDLTPPALSILAVSPAIAQGGSGIVAYRATGAVTSESMSGFGYRGGRSGSPAASWNHTPWLLRPRHLARRCLAPVDCTASAGFAARCAVSRAAAHATSSATRWPI